MSRTNNDLIKIQIKPLIIHENMKALQWLGRASIKWQAQVKGRKNIIIIFMIQRLSHKTVSETPFGKLRE